MSKIVCSKELFSEDVVRLTCKAFGDFAQFSVKETESCWNITCSDVECDSEQLEKEFRNYMIDLTCKLKKW